MILAVDSSALALLINPAATPPNDPVTAKPLERARERVDHLAAGLSAFDTLLIPTPVLAEALVRAEEGGPGVLAALTGMARVRLASFGMAAAVETAAMTREAILKGDKRAGSQAAWQKVKFDRQIIAIARVERATCLYADDKDLVDFATRLGMEVFSTRDLPLPQPEEDLFTLAGLPIDQARVSGGAQDRASTAIGSVARLTPLHDRGGEPVVTPAAQADIGDRPDPPR